MAGVHRLLLPLDRHSLGHVNVYALEADSGLLLIDCGWSTRQTRRDLLGLLGQIGRQRNEIRTVLLTHSHSDHAGMAGWLREAGASIAAHPRDAAGTGRQLGARAFVQQTAQWQLWAGMPEQFRPEATRYALHQHELGWRGDADIELRDGMTIQHGRFTLSVIAVPGHTPGSVAFYEHSTKSLFTGDTLFARSHFGPSLRTLHDGDPLSDYLASLERLEQFDISLALPGHNSPFTNAAERLAAGRAHHIRRAEIVSDLARLPPATAWSIAARTPRTQDWSTLTVAQRSAAAAEVGAHLARLAHTGEVPDERLMEFHTKR